MMTTTASAKGCLRYEDKNFDEDSWRIIRKELKETEENKKRCLDILKKKILEKHDLNAFLNDDFLLSFLRVSKYDCGKAFQRLIKYYEDRRDMPEIFDDYLPSSVEPVRSARYIYLSPYRSKKDNSAVLIWKRGDYEPSKHPYELILRYAFLTSDLLLQEEMNQIHGVTFIVDMTSPSWSSWSEVTPGRLKLVARLMQKSTPLRIRGFHFINAPPVYYIFYSIIYPFLSTKMRNRMNLHKNFASLHESIDPEILPKEYEGDLEQTDLIDIYDKLREKEEYFEKFSKFGFLRKKK